MTEAEWMRSTDLSAMLGALGAEVADSKLRLFACACCRSVWDLIPTGLHRRAVAYAEWFARGPGRDLRWLGAGHWATRRLSLPVEQIEQAQGWRAIHQGLRAEEAGRDEATAAFRYDHWTPEGTAAATLHLRYDMPYYVARGVASMRTAPFAYWRHSRGPELSDAEEQRWVARIDQELAAACELFRQIYGRPNLVEPGAPADPGRK